MTHPQRRGRRTLAFTYAPASTSTRGLAQDEALLRPAFLGLAALLISLTLGTSPAPALPVLVDIPPDPSATTQTHHLVRPPASTDDIEVWLGERIGRFGEFEFSVIGGKPGHRTPEGAFQVEWRSRHHRSRQFNMAPMPFAVFFKGGAAIHEGSLASHSHGCVRVTASTAARIFYNVREKDTRVIVYP